jgi:hypothetical protein
VRRFYISLTFAAAVLLSAPSVVWAIAGFSAVATEGKRVGENPQWPAKMMDVVNDPARTVGWNFWFSKCPNDVNHYAFVAKSTDDLNRVLKKLAAVDAKGTTIILTLGKEFPVGNFSFLKKGNNAAAVLAFGNQATINQWYVHLKEPEGEPGVKKFGVHRYTEPPKAMSPTLTIYVENPAVEVEKLVIPAALMVATAITKEEREARKDEAPLKAIDALLLKRQRAAELR